MTIDEIVDALCELPDALRVTADGDDCIKYIHDGSRTEDSALWDILGEGWIPGEDEPYYGLDTEAYLLVLWRKL